jgi:rubrerythrin
MLEQTAAERSLSSRSRKNLLEAMRGEAFAYAKYKLFAQKARETGHFEVADLFDRTADQEFFEHFAEEADLLGLVKNDEQDIRDAIAGESYEVETMYKNFAEEAIADGDNHVAHRFLEVRHDETVHQLAFEEALMKMQARDRLMKGRADIRIHDS